MEILAWIVLIVIVLGILVAIAISGTERETTEAQERIAAITAPTPPTNLQLNYIDALIQEREVEDWMLEEDPQTMEDASELIDMLKSLPYTDRGMP